MRRFKTFKSLAEASLMKPDYVIGHKVVWKGTDFAELGRLGYNKGDVFEIVSGGKVEVSVGKETGEFEKFIKGPDGKVIRIKGGAGYKSSAFTHYKEGGGIPSGAEWEDLIVVAYNNLNKKPTDPATEEVGMKKQESEAAKEYEIRREQQGVRSKE